MANYYLDIETAGLNERQDKIITIQYQELERGTGRPVGEVTVLKEWELGERSMLSSLIATTAISGRHVHV